jgi:pyridinium-3,5-biscarboxylic acid mononucleotide synthase
VDQASLRQLLDQVSAGAMSVDRAVQELRHLPFEDLGFAKVDHHRDLRTCIGEMIYCPGKTPDQVREIARSLARRCSGAILATRADRVHARSIAEAVPEPSWHPIARLVIVRASPPADPQGRVPVLSAGTSDLPVAEEAALSVEALGHCVERLYDVGVAGIHRLLPGRDRLATADLLIVCAGMDGVLPSLVAGLVGGLVIAVLTPDAQTLAPSATLTMNEAVAQRRAAGGETIHLGFGEAAFPLHPLLHTALTKAAKHTSYAPVLGLPALRQAIAEHLARTRTLTCSPEHIVVAPGSSDKLIVIIGIWYDTSGTFGSAGPGTQRASRPPHLMPYRVLCKGVE